MVCYKNGSCILAADVPTITELGSESLSERVPGFLTELADILLIVAKQRDGRIGLQLVDVLSSTSFIPSMFKWYIESLADCDDFTSKNTKQFMKEDGAHEVVMKGGSAKKEGCCTLYVKDATELLRKHVKFCRKDDIMF